MNVVGPLKVSQSITLQLHLEVVIELLPLFYELVVMIATTLKPYEMEIFINAFNFIRIFKCIYTKRIQCLFEAVLALNAF